MASKEVATRTRTIEPTAVHPPARTGRASNSYNTYNTRTSSSGKRASKTVTTVPKQPKRIAGDSGSKRRLNLGNFAFNPRNPSGYQHVLMGEMIAAFVIIGIRAVSDYAPAENKHDPGTENPVKGASPVSLIVATLAVYFVLSFLATRGGWPARVAAAFGLLMIAGLMVNSEAELKDVANWIENIGTNSTNQPAVTAPSGGNSGGSSSSNNPTIVQGPVES